MIGIVLPYYNFIGYADLPTDAHLTVFSRNDALAWACRLQVANCVQNARSQYASVMLQPSSYSRSEFSFKHLIERANMKL